MWKCTIVCKTHRQNEPRKINQKVQQHASDAFRTSGLEERERYSMFRERLSLPCQLFKHRGDSAPLSMTRSNLENARRPQTILRSVVAFRHVTAPLQWLVAVLNDHCEHCEEWADYG